MSESFDYDYVNIEVHVKVGETLCKLDDYIEPYKQNGYRCDDLPQIYYYLDPTAPDTGPKPYDAVQVMKKTTLKD